MYFNRKKWISSRICFGASILATALTLIGCGGGGGSTSDDVAGSMASFAGLWSGTVVSSVTGGRTDVVGVTLQDGESMYFAPRACSLFRGSSTWANSKAVLTATAYWEGYCYGATESFRGGWVHGPFPPATTPLSATGAFRELDRATLQYSNGVGDKGSVDLAYWNLYERTSSIAGLVGLYTNSPSLAVTIDGSGRFSATETVTRLAFSTRVNYAGQFSLIDPKRNLYRVVLRSSEASGTFSGFAYVTDSAAGKSNDAVVVFTLQDAGTVPFVHYWIRQ